MPETAEGRFGLDAEKMRRFKPPKGGWIYRQPETGWRPPGAMSNSHEETVDKIVNHRKANPHLQLPTDRETADRDLQQFTALRIISDAPDQVRGWVVPLDDAAVQKKTPSNWGQSLIQAGGAALAGVGRRVKRDFRALRVLGDWLGSGGVPVAAGLAASRARVCSTCPFNQPGKQLESAVAGAIKAHVAAKNELALTTPDDDKLQTCAVCSCHLPLKVWVPLEKVLRDTSVHGLPPHCWIVNEKPARPKLAIRRHISHGDVIATSVLAERIADHGYDVTLVCAPHVADALHHHKRISISSGTHHDINLDSTYESSPQLATKSIYELFWDAANTQLRRFGFDIGTATNCLPNLVVTDDEKQKMRAKMPLGKKNIVIVPKSNWSKNRVVPEPIWRNVATAIGSDYACYWTSTNEKCFPPLTNLSVKTFRETMAALALADLVVTVDTGPMHAAAGLKKPVLAIQQAFRIDLRLTDHTDWQSVGADLDCLGCCKYYCPINKDEPPCCIVPSKVIADAIVERFKIFDMTRVAAVVPVYKPNRDRLERCIKAIEDQVSEIVIALDGDAVVDCKHPKVRVVKNPTGKRTGYGKTIMRGARLTNSGWILQLNDDCYMNPGAVAKMVEAADERTAIVGCLLRYPDGRIQHGGIVMGKEIGWGHIDHLKTEPSIRTVVDAPGVTLAAGLTRRSAFYEVGGFDDEFDCYGEDEDICRTFRRDGWKIRYTPFASGVHDEHQTSGSSRAGMMEASHAILRRKWLVKK